VVNGLPATSDAAAERRVKVVVNFMIRADRARDVMILTVERGELVARRVS